MREVIVDEEPAGTLRLVVHWQGGSHTAFEMKKPMSATGRKTDNDDIKIITLMAPRYGDDEIARVLNKLGRRTGTGNRWNETRVKSARKSRGLSGQRRRIKDDDVLSLNGAAHHVNVSDTTIRRLVEAGLLPMQQVAPFAPWEIRRDDLESEPICSIIERLRATGELNLAGGTFGAQQSLFDTKSITYSERAS